jgi:hypothetical protein
MTSKKQARKLPRISPPVKWMLIRNTAYSSRRKISWLNAQLAEAVKFSSHKSQSGLQNQYFA